MTKTTQTLAEQHADAINAWDDEHRDREGADLWNDLLYGMDDVDQEASPEYSGLASVVFRDGSVLAYDGRAGRWAHDPTPDGVGNPITEIIYWHGCPDGDGWTTADGDTISPADARRHYLAGATIYVDDCAGARSSAPRGMDPEDVVIRAHRT